MLSCTIALVLALDISLSLSPTHLEMQRRSVHEVFRDQGVQSVIEQQPDGVAVSVIEWAAHPVVIANWQILRTRSDAVRFADQLENSTNFNTRAGGTTAIGNALEASINAFESVPCNAERQIIDISGDGKNNDGPQPTEFRERAESLGITINGLPIIGGEPTIVEYYQSSVVTSDGFVLEARGFSDFARALRRKMILEITMR